MSDEDWDAVINTNLRGTFLFTRAVTRPMMQSRYGRIINIASVSGLMGNPGQANYSASKAGIIGMTRTVAKELASRKITVNAVAPGFIETEMTDALGPVVLDEVKKRIPAKRLGKAEEIAGLRAVFGQWSRRLHHRPGAHDRRGHDRLSRAIGVPSKRT